VKDFLEYRNAVISNCEQVIKGKSEIIEKVLVSFLCSGHILLEDVPGTGKTMLSILQEESDEAAVQDERERLWREKVLRSFFDEDGRLRTIPAQRKKRLIVLERIAEAFEQGRTYSEREVNLVIADFHDDFCTLRREMVDEHLMTREDGKYRRVF